MGSQSGDISSALKEALAALGAAESPEVVRSILSQAVGKKGSLGALKSSLGSIADIEQRKQAGVAINAAMAELTHAADARISEMSTSELLSGIERDRVDVTERALKSEVAARLGRTHLVTQATERLEDVFIGLGFQIAEGPEVESDFYNFEALNMPPSHPARSMWDTLFIDQDPQESVLLRTHTSPVQVRVMQEWPPPIYAIMPGRVFRRDTPDATHMPVFHQIEGMVIDRNITFSDLAGTIEAFTKAFFGSEFTSRLRPSYFPFTEPSAEFDIRRPDGSWIELGGCGMMHPRVIRAGGLDPDEWGGFA
ncbi:MAG: phenylalanine--tRNA ligase subunit alpha, partial [Actinomycetota bacterium]